jgi:hypothetical protein
MLSAPTNCYLYLSSSYVKPAPDIQHHLDTIRSLHHVDFKCLSSFQAKKAKQAEIDRKRAEVRKRLEETAKAKKAKKGFMTPERKKKLRVSGGHVTGCLWLVKFCILQKWTKLKKITLIIFLY